MTVLIIYGSIEGQTAKIAEFAAKLARDAGFEPVLFNTEDRTGDITFEGVDKVILAGPVHERRFPKPFEVFVSGQSETLARYPTLLLSVSLSAAFEERMEEAQDYADEMKLRTGLAPSDELLVAGAIRTESYDYYASQVLRHVVLRGNEAIPTEKNHEFTDWDALAARVAAFLGTDATAS